MPMPNTVADFWRLLYDYHSDTVVMLNEFDRNDKVSQLELFSRSATTEKIIINKKILQMADRKGM